MAWRSAKGGRSTGAAWLTLISGREAGKLRSAIQRRASITGGGSVAAIAGLSGQSRVITRPFGLGRSEPSGARKCKGGGCYASQSQRPGGAKRSAGPVGQRLALSLSPLKLTVPAGLFWLWRSARRESQHIGATGLPEDRAQLCQKEGAVCRRAARWSTKHSPRLFSDPPHPRGYLCQSEGASRPALPISLWRKYPRRRHG